MTFLWTRRARPVPSRPARAGAHAAGERGARHRRTAGTDLAGRAGRALGWSVTNSAVARLSTVGVGIMLARLLGPRDFGIYAVGYVALNLLLNLNDLGVSFAIVRWPGDPSAVVPTVTTISLVSSAVCYLGCFAGAPAYAAAMGAPSATGLIRVLAIVVVVDGAVATPAALLKRSFRQDLKMIADQANVWLGTGVTVALALAGFGPMSLALGRLAGCAAALVLFLVFSPQRPRLGFDPAIARALLRFGLPLAGSDMIAFAITSVDQLIVGRALGVTALGFYVLAWNLSAWPITAFSRPLRNVAPAAFARIQHDPPAMRTGFVSVASLLTAVSLPVCLAISGSAVPLTGFLYGARWLPAAQALVWLAMLAALRIFFELTYDYFVVLARTRVIFAVQFGWLLVLIPALVAGAEVHGISGAALAEFLVAAGMTLPWYLAALGRAGVLLRPMLAGLWLPVTGGTVTGLVSVVAAGTLPGRLGALACSGVSGVVITGLLLYRMRPVLTLIRETGRRGEMADAAAAAVPATAGGEDAVARDVTRAGVGVGGAHGARAPVPGPPRVPAMPAVLGPSRSPYADTTGPIPLYRDLAVPLRQPHDAEPLPLYRQTVRALRWDPAAARVPARAGTRGRSQAPALRESGDEIQPAQ